MHGVYAGIVDAELKLNPSMHYWNEWWNEFRGFRFGGRWNSRHTWPGLIGNVYSTCDASSPHQFCSAQDDSTWRENFRNFPLIMNVRSVYLLMRSLMSLLVHCKFLQV